MQHTEIKRRMDALGLKPADIQRVLKADDPTISIHSARRLINGERKITAGELELIRQLFTEREDYPNNEGRVPIYGYVSASDGDRLSTAEDRVLEWIDPPKGGFMSGITAAFRVAGESMEPRLFAGEIVYAAFGVPPIKGQDCIVELADGSAIVKTYAARRDGQIFLKQWNPPQEIRLRADEVKAIHAVRARA